MNFDSSNVLFHHSYIRRTKKNNKEDSYNVRHKTTWICLDLHVRTQYGSIPYKIKQTKQIKNPNFYREKNTLYLKIKIFLYFNTKKMGSKSLYLDDCLNQVRCRLRLEGIQLWKPPYYMEGIGPIESELEVFSVIFFALYSQYYKIELILTSTTNFGHQTGSCSTNVRFIDHVIAGLFSCHC